MSLLHMDSCECVKSELDLFNLPPTQTSIEGTRFEKYYPLTSLDRGGPLEFKIHTGDREYIDPDFIFLYMQTRILDQDGDELEEDADPEAAIPDQSLVFPINYFHATCFKSIEVHLNGKSVSGNDTLYPYRSYLECLLSYNSDSKEEHLKTSLFYKDKGELDSYSKDLDLTEKTQNSGATARLFISKLSKSFETLGRLHSEIFSQGKLLLNKVEMNIKLQRADQKFSLMAFDDTSRYNITIDKAVLYAAHKTISDSVREAHEMALLTRNAKYPMRKIQMKFFTRGAQRSDLSEPNLVNGILPRRIVFGLVDSSGFNGSLHHNPFNFQHFEVRHIILRKNGQPVPFQDIDLDFENDHFFEGYLSLLHGTGRLFKNINQGIQPLKDFKNGYAIYAFDLTPDHSDSGNFNLIQEGNISLDIKLNKPHNTGITIVCYLEYDSVLEIDKDRNIYYE